MRFSRRSFLRPPGWKRQSCTKHLPSNKGDHVSDLIRFCQTLDGYCRDQRQFVFICTGEAGEHSCIRSTGATTFTRTPVRRLPARRTSSALHRMFAGHVNGRPSGADTSIGRRDVDDAPASLWSIMRSSCFMLSSVPSTLVSKVAAKLSAVCSVTGPGAPSVPALLTATSRRPKRLTV